MPVDNIAEGRDWWYECLAAPVADSLCTRKRNFLCKYVKTYVRLFVNDANEECAKLPRQ